jgi:hypothetical protein
MVTDDLVTLDAVDIRRVADAFRRAGVNVEGAYLIKTTSDENSAFWSIKVVTRHDSRDFIYKLVDLRRTGALGKAGYDISINAEKPTSIEASRVLDYAAQFNRAPVKIRGVYWKGLFIEYALVAEGPGLHRAVA